VIEVTENPSFARRFPPRRDWTRKISIDRERDLDFDAISARRAADYQRRWKVRSSGERSFSISQIIAAQPSTHPRCVAHRGADELISPKAARVSIHS